MPSACSNGGSPSEHMEDVSNLDPGRMEIDSAGLESDFEGFKTSSLTALTVPSSTEELCQTLITHQIRSLAPSRPLIVSTNSTRYPQSVRITSENSQYSPVHHLSPDPGVHSDISDDSSNPSIDGTFFASSLLVALQECADLMGAVEVKLNIGKEDLQHMRMGLSRFYDDWKAGLKAEISKLPT